MPNNCGERRAFGEKPWNDGKPKGKARRWFGKFTGLTESGTGQAGRASRRWGL
ncbi:Hypothetical protein CGLY_00125 [Corynebacterium glyciniphilum AJ 3170]|uniref:Uncharacterized protein n=1 Tax=Corynebacterium glyciniphilum AJ 3170 TaxID=1404245 RepID=X5DHH0_9CORY|nr:Hypothetical protein CGLY_00125 [Corynebacterium glyciniphilum AJ 3170]